MQNRLRVRRAELDVTQLEVARKIGTVSASQISLVENGLADPSPELRAALARVLKTTEADLFPELASASAERDAR